MVFECRLQAKRKLNDHAESSPISSIASTEAAKGLKVPKLEAPSFDGSVLNWTNFWEQFTVSIDKCRETCLPSTGIEGRNCSGSDRSVRDWQALY